MFFYSTNGISEKADFKTATINGQAPDKGLYFPEAIPRLSDEIIKNLKNYSREEIAFKVIEPYVGKTIPDTSLKQIVEETSSFPIPLISLSDRISSLELFHGPTLAFKDIGARFMSRCLGYFMKDRDQRITVLVATSGDTGGAVANGFHNVEGIDVVILYPSGKVSSIQEMQLTTLEGNVTALEVDGSFDDCQRMVKHAFTDKEVNEKIFLTSANSINVARWLPQQFYYFFALQQWQHNFSPVISVPSGNFGNICAGMLAHRSGLPVRHFIAACNENDVASNYLNTGIYEPKRSAPTISNAMDVGDPSNFIRILNLFGHDVERIRSIMSAYRISDEETRQAIAGIYTSQQYILDPHGAVAYEALKNYLNEQPDHQGIFLETAHPVKFYDVVEPVLNIKIPVPASIMDLTIKKKKSIHITADNEALKVFLLKI